MGGWNPPYEWFTMPDFLQPGRWDLPAMGQQQTKHREDLWVFQRHFMNFHGRR